MKTAIYIEDGLLQLVLTPENKFERAALSQFQDKSTLHTTINEGQFHECQGGWTRQYPDGPSLIIRAQPETKSAEADFPRTA